LPAGHIPTMARIESSASVIINDVSGIANWLDHYLLLPHCHHADTIVVPCKVEALARRKKTAVNEWVFVNRSGQPYKSIRTAFEYACRHVGWPHISPAFPGFPLEFPCNFHYIFHITTQGI
jgi:hypothetical protein